MTQTIINLGTGGAVLNGQNGSTAGADSNDALFLDWESENYVYLPGAVNNFMSVPDAAALDITGDLDLRIQVAMDDWTPAATQTFIAKRTFSNFSYWFIIQSDGTLILGKTSNGSTYAGETSTAAVSATNGQKLWIRVTLDVDNGSSQNVTTFFQSSDGSTWTQIGAAKVQAGAFTTFSGSAPLEVGTNINGTNEPLAGKVYRAQVFSGINGTKVLDIDTSVVSSGSATTFTALTGQTVTINRSAAGRKSVAVVSPVWLFGTDDFMQVPNNALINFGTSQDCTILVAYREWATWPNNGRIIDKRDIGVGLVGYGLHHAATSQLWSATISDGATAVAYQAQQVNYGTMTVAGFVVNRSLQTIRTFTNGVVGASPSSTASVGNINSAVPLRIGALGSGSFFGDFELLAASVFRRALTATEIAQVNAYYQARLS